MQIDSLENSEGPSNGFLTTTEKWLGDCLLPWVSDQLEAVSSQIVALTISALAGGLISWLITRRADERARSAQNERDKKIRHEQELRDEQRNLFEYRHWKVIESSREEKQWNVNINTTPWYRYNWVLSATPKFQSRVISARFHIESMSPGKPSVELTNEFASRSQKIPPLGVTWVKDDQGHGHWESDHGDSHFFTFDIGKLIDDSDSLVISYELTDGTGGYEIHFISPFDSMKTYRPWEVVELEEDKES